MRRVWQPAVVLVLLSPVVGELLSGSSPPAEFFNPLTFVLLTAFYGSGALLVRELTVRWKKGWPSILLLGMAYGIVEEGLAVKSFFDPAWMDLGVLGVYGRWAGVNWVWAVGLTLYHAVFSIAIPIALTYLLFPQRAHEAWIRPRALRIWAAVLASVVILCNLLLTSYRPPAGYFLLAGAVVFLLGLLARRGAASPGEPVCIAAAAASDDLVVEFRGDHRAVHWLVGSAEHRLAALDHARPDHRLGRPCVLDRLPPGRIRAFRAPARFGGRERRFAVLHSAGADLTVGSAGP